MYMDRVNYIVFVNTISTQILIQEDGCGSYFPCNVEFLVRYSTNGQHSIYSFIIFTQLKLLPDSISEGQIFKHFPGGIPPDSLASACFTC